jgi:hypothetical protein
VRRPAGKRWRIQRRHAATLPRSHEILAWLGSLLVLVHAAVHINAIPEWLAVCAMLIGVGSGRAGKPVLDPSRHRRVEARQPMRVRGLSEDPFEDHPYRDSPTFDAVGPWRAVHVPITPAFAVRSMAHIVAILLFRGWK